VKPDYEKNGVTLYCADCRDVLPTLGKVDAVVTSPPYNQRIETFSPSGMHTETRWVEKISDGYFDSMPEDEYQADQINILTTIFSVTNDHASVFYNHKIRWRDGFMIHPLTWITKTPWRMRQEIVWRRNGSCTLNARMFGPSDERIYWMVKDRHKWNQDCVGFLTVWDLGQQNTPDHPCAYPIEYPNRAISATTDRDDQVLDPFMGSGTTGVACVRLGRKFIGIEIEPKYFEIAVRRIESAMDETSLLDYGAKQEQEELAL